MPETDVLTQIRGNVKPARANARSVAALTKNPGCVRRRIFDAARIPAHYVADRLGHPASREQSPFAIATGIQFEQRLKQGSNYALLVEALAPYVRLPEKPKHVAVKAPKNTPLGEPSLLLRAERTRALLKAIALGKPDAPDLVDHPVFVLDLGGTSVFLEPDALAIRVGKNLELVEIKSYGIIDDQADPSKLASTAGQAAVYLLAIRATLASQGLSPDIGTPSVLLVAPRNFGRKPVAYRIPLKKKIMALERVLRSIPRTDDLLEGLNLPPKYTLDVCHGVGALTEKERRSLERAVRSLPMLYVPECLSSCDLAKYCRHQAIDEDNPSRLGRTARDSLAGVPKLADALRLATKGTGPGEEGLRDVAESLQNGYEALRRARARAGLGQASSRRRSGR